MNKKGTTKACMLCDPRKVNEEINNWSQVEYWSNLQSILDTTHDGFILFSKQLKIIMCNQSFKKIVKEITGNFPEKNFDIFNFIKPGNKKNIQHFVDDVLQGNIVEYDLAHCTEDKNTRWLHIHIYPVKNETGGTNGICVSIRDITTRKKGEEALLYNAALMDNMRDMVISTDLNFNIVCLNKAAEKLTQATVSEVTGRPAPDVFNFIYDSCTRVDAFNELQKNGYWQGKIIFNRKDGKKLHLSSVFTPVKDSMNKMIGYLGVHADISDKIQIEELISKQQRYIHSVFEAAPEALFLLNPDNTIIIFNKRAKRVIQKFLGAGIENGMNLIEMLPELRQDDVRNKLSKARSGHPFDYEVQYPGGLWLWVSFIPVKDKEGKVSEICVGLRDITIYKNLEFELRKSEEQYRSLFESLAEGVVYQSSDKKIITCNHRAEKILGIKKEMLQREEFPLPAWRLFNQKKGEIKFGEYLSVDTKQYRPIRDLTLGIQRESKIQWLSLNIEPVYDKNGEIKGRVFSFSDISKRMKMDKELQILFMAAKKINNSVVITDSKKRIVWVNKAFTNNTGYTFEEAKGKVPGQILQGPGIDPKTIKLMRDALRKETSFECEVQNYKKSGEKFWMRIQVQPLPGSNGKVSGYLGVGANVTEQKKLQEKLVRQKVERQKEITRATIAGQEKERNELGRELHDNINQILAATKLQLECHLKSEKGKPECITNSHEYLNLAINEIRSLSKHLVSPRFQEHNLVDEINFVIANLGLDNKTTVEINKFPEEEIPEEIKLAIFRIVQEQLNNILKYAQANSITIKLRGNESSIELVIKDDGRGFDMTKIRNGIGLNNIQTRAEFYNGSAKIISAPGKGCCVQISIPVKKAEIENFTF